MARANGCRKSSRLYSYDFLDNCGRPSAERIIPELQQLSVGMIFSALPGMTDGFTLLAFERDRSLILGWRSPNGALLMTWAFVLQEYEDRATRLIVRARAGPGYQFHGLPWWLGKRAVALVHFIMPRKQLLGIARRVESAAADSFQRGPVGNRGAARTATSARARDWWRSDLLPLPQLTGPTSVSRGIDMAIRPLLTPRRKTRCSIASCRRMKSWSVTTSASPHQPQSHSMSLARSISKRRRSYGRSSQRGKSCSVRHRHSPASAWTPCRGAVARLGCVGRRLAFAKAWRAVQTRGLRASLQRLLVSQRHHWVNSRRSPRWHVTRDERDEHQ